jgi:hypothetical protein
LVCPRPRTPAAASVLLAKTCTTRCTAASKVSTLLSDNSTCLNLDSGRESIAAPVVPVCDGSALLLREVLAAEAAAIAAVFVSAVQQHTFSTRARSSVAAQHRQLHTSSVDAAIGSNSVAL